jgi:hypothetical protein
METSGSSTANGVYAPASPGVTTKGWWADAAAARSVNNIWRVYD